MPIMSVKRISDGRHASQVLVGSFIALVFYALRAEASPQSPNDVFTSPCGSFLSDPPPRGYLRWSSPATWPNGVVPGVGAAAGANATIPCGAAVLLDVPTLSLGLLRVMGALKFADDAAVGDIALAASFVLVEGTFIMGTEAQQFSRKATITLTPNTQFGRAPLLYTSSLPAEPAFPRSLGHKAFAVVGGQVNFHGLPGPRTMPTWCRLSATAEAGDTKIYVDQKVAGVWPVGAVIGLASTDYSREQAERFTITAVAASGGGGAVIMLDRPLAFMHWGGALDDGFGGSLEQRGEVALLSRNIVMTATQEPAPYALEGGHFIVFFTQVPQYVEGLQSVRMGQQGTLGRYPIHMHFAGNQQGGTYIRKNAIMDTKQRCVVIHASFNVTVYDNVAFNTAGHCFMVEEGGETGNVFEHNLGILTKAATKLIADDETDGTPSTFWITNMGNHYLNNVAAGSADSGFWFELRDAVRGLSKLWARVNETIPVLTNLGTFSGNVAHSNVEAGVRTYPHGSRPRPGATWDGWERPGPSNVLANMNVYKNGQWGLFVHATDRLVIRDSTFSDNGIGVMLNRDEGVSVQLSRFLALSSNIGNPVLEGCSDANQWSGCKPVVGCKMPLANGQLGRSVYGWRDQPAIGVGIDQSARDESPDPNLIVSCKFANYDATCRPAAGVALQVTFGPEDFFNAGHAARGLKFDKVSNRVWAMPQGAKFFSDDSPLDQGEPGQFYALRDLDGSILGGTPGYVIANNPKILPLNPQRSCTFNARWNAYGCPGACYRTVSVSFIEPGFAVGAGNKMGQYSSLVVTRVEDSKVLTLNGNILQEFQQDGQPPSERFFVFNVLAGMTYSVSVTGGTKSPPGFFPAGYKIEFRDGPGCGQGLKLRLPAKSGHQWRVGLEDDVVPSPCAGGEAPPASAATWQILCQAGSGLLEATLGSAFGNSIALTATATATSCLPTTLCNLVSSSSAWSYDDSGAELRPQFFNPGFPASTWKSGRAVFAYVDEGSFEFHTTPVQKPGEKRLTYYFRKWFNVKNSACVTALSVQFAVTDGVVLYLNNKEMGRHNMPAGRVTAATKAKVHQEFYSSDTWPYVLNWTAQAWPALNLVEGRNLIAAEVHSFEDWEWLVGFDLRLTALSRPSGCSGGVSTPEVCDGVDNNLNGKVDEGPDGKPMTRACKTVCGAGIETCRGGAWQGCTAVKAVPETCNGRDDDCDGLVDNGMGQLDCGAGKGCYGGRCLPVGDLTRRQQVWGRNASGWFFFDQGGNYDAESPNWRLGDEAAEAAWSSGAAPLGYEPSNPKAKFGTVLSSIAGKYSTLYFLKSFDLTAADVAATYSLGLSVRRDDGAVVFVNGREVMRTNMPRGIITYRTLATEGTEDGGDYMPKTAYYPCSACSPTTASFLKAGTNWVAAEVHQADIWSEDAGFDLELWRNVYQTCATALPAAPPACILKPVQPTVFWELSSVWKYSDGRLASPPASWTSPAFDDSKWPAGKGLLGYGENSDITTILKKTNGKGQRVVSYYFRKAFSTPDAACHFSLAHAMFALDGAVVYLNGREVYRTRMPAGPVTPATFSSDGGNWDKVETKISGGWLRAGTNVVAVEVHQAPDSTDDLFFDSTLTGLREGASCKPGPSLR